MAKLEMDLQEFKALEDKVVKAEALTEIKVKQIEDLKLKLKEVEANKMVVKKTIYDKTPTLYTKEIVLTPYPQERLSPNYMSFDDTGMRILRSIIERLNPIITHYGVNNGRRDYRSAEEDVSHVLSGLKFDIAIDDRNDFSKAEDTIEYINFDDVQRELREKAEASVAKELGELREKFMNSNAEVARLNSEYQESLKDQRKKYQKEKEEIIEKHKEIIEQLDKAYMQVKDEYDDLKNDKDMRTTEEKLNREIEDLKSELYTLNNKSWIQRLFNL